MWAERSAEMVGELKRGMPDIQHEIAHLVGGKDRVAVK